MIQNFSTSPELNGRDEQPHKPDSALRRLEVLVGTWKIEGRESGPDGEINGQVTFEWMEGGFFLVQHVDIDHKGQKIRGIEIIGYDDSARTFTSHFFDNMGNISEYVWEVGRNTLTIWGGYVGSPARLKGKFSNDGNTFTGSWKWPGGGYTVTMTRAGVNKC